MKLYDQERSAQECAEAVAALRSWDPKGDLHAAIDALPISDRRKVDAKAELTAGLFHGLFSAADETPPMGTAKAAAELAELDRLIAGMIYHIRSMRGDSLRYFDEESEAPFDLLFMLFDSRDNVRRAQQRLAAAPFVPAPTGRPAKRRAEHCARWAAMAYQRWTERAGTVVTNDGAAGGPFVAFVAAVFRAVKVDADAATYARRAIAADARRPMGKSP